MVQTGSLRISQQVTDEFLCAEVHAQSIWPYPELVLEQQTTLSAPMSPLTMKAAPA
jgi:hypothetical protein